MQFWPQPRAATGPTGPSSVPATAPLRKRSRRAHKLAIACALIAGSVATLAPPATAADPPQTAAPIWMTAGSYESSGNAWVTTFAFSGRGTVYIGGNFTHLTSPDGSESVPRRNLAEIDLATGRPTSWDPKVSSY